MNPQSNHSAIKLKGSQETPDAFYQLHYPQKKASPHQSRFRAKSVLSVTEKQNPELMARQQNRKKLSQEEKVAQVSQMLQKQKIEPPKLEPFSFKKALSGKEERSHLSEYFSKYDSHYFGTVQQIARQNTGIRHALQKCKDQKVKVAKVLSSQRQPEITKMDYLQLKKQEIQDEKKMQVRQIYDQFFKKEYEMMYGQAAFDQFSHRMEEMVSAMHGQLFGRV